VNLWRSIRGRGSESWKLIEWGYYY